jgi:hypothetical protein
MSEETLSRLAGREIAERLFYWPDPEAPAAGHGDGFPG